MQPNYPQPSSVSNSGDMNYGILLLKLRFCRNSSKPWVILASWNVGKKKEAQLPSTFNLMFHILLTPAWEITLNLGKFWRIFFQALGDIADTMISSLKLYP